MQRSRRTRLIIAAIATACVVVVAFILITMIPAASSTATLDDQALEAKALEWARVNGLQGNPISKRIAHMTLSQWFALLKQQLGPDSAKFGLIPDMPVFILAVRGKVERRDSQSPLSGQTTPEQFDNITVAVDARNGNPISVGSARDPSMMPIPVPLSVRTPTAPIGYVPTQPPVTPPTLPPKVTLTPTPIQSVLPTPMLR